MKTLRILAICLTMLICLASFASVVSAEETAEPHVLVDEPFDDFEPDANGDVTTLADYFMLDANAIGDGYIKIHEDATGNLYLRSHVFTQIVLSTPLTSAYHFSADVYRMDGQEQRQSGFFFRAPATRTSYYEADGDSKDHPNSIGHSGLWIIIGREYMDINVKTYAKKAKNNVVNNVVRLPLPEGSTMGDGKFVKLDVYDTGKEMAIYADGHLMCTVVFGAEGKAYPPIEITEVCFDTLQVLDAEGTRLLKAEGTLVSCNQSVIGWATRAANMDVDTILLERYESLELPKETETDTDVPDTGVATTETEESASAVTSEAVGNEATEAPTVGTDAGDGEESGCNSSMLGFSAMVAVLGGVIMFAKKKD